VTDLTDAELARYARQIVLRDVDLEGQARLRAGRVLIVGLGGLGSPAALYLAGAGVGHLVLADYDAVDLSNLHRQVIHRSADIGRPKVESARDAVRALNPDVAVTTLHARMEPDALAAQVAAVDVVLDCTDNFEARFAINAACVAARRPLVSGAAIRLDGQVAVFRADVPDAPCYRCLYREQGTQAEHCSQVGVLGPVVGVIGAMQALEALKLLAGFGEPLAGRLLLFDARASEWRMVRLRRDPDCPACGGRPPA
jgi:molybdopterin-synthase adenylyltransferase